MEAENLEGMIKRFKNNYYKITEPVYIKDLILLMNECTPVDQSILRYLKSDDLQVILQLGRNIMALHMNGVPINLTRYGNQKQSFSIEQVIWFDSVAKLGINNLDENKEFSLPDALLYLDRVDFRSKLGHYHQYDEDYGVSFNIEEIELLQELITKIPERLKGWKATVYGKMSSVARKIGRKSKTKEDEYSWLVTSLYYGVLEYHHSVGLKSDKPQPHMAKSLFTQAHIANKLSEFYHISPEEFRNFSEFSNTFDMRAARFNSKIDQSKSIYSLSKALERAHKIYLEFKDRSSLKNLLKCSEIYKRQYENMVLTETPTKTAKKVYHIADHHIINLTPLLN